MSAFEKHDPSPLRARGRFSSMSPHNGRTGVVQYIHHSDAGNPYAMVNFERSVEGHNDTKAIPLSAFPNGYVRPDDNVTVYVGSDRDGDRRNLARRVLEAIGVLKESTKVQAVINVHASEQHPDHDLALDPPRHKPERSILTRIGEGIDSVIARVVEGASAVFKAVSRLGRQSTVLQQPIEKGAQEVYAPAPAPGVAGLVEIDPKEVDSLLRGLARANISPQARATAARSKAEVRAIAVEQARKHAGAQKAQEQGKQAER